MPVVVSITHLLLLHYYNWWSCWGVKSAGEWIWFSCLSASCRQTSKVSKKKCFWGGDLIRLPVWSFSPSTHDARCYSSHSVCSHNICHKCSLCNRNSQSGLPSSCAPRPPPPSPALTFFFPLASYDSHVLYKKMHEWCTGLIPDLCQLLTAFFIQEIIAWLFIYLRSLECCLSLPPLKCLFFFFTSIHATDFFLPLVFPSHTDSSYICRPPD